MFVSVNKLANKLPKDKPDNRAANALQEGQGKAEMRTMMQTCFKTLVILNRMRRLTPLF
jgi:Mn-containing catalase